MIRSLRNLLKKFKCFYEYIILILLRSPVDTVLCIINAWFLKCSFEVIQMGNREELIKICIGFCMANIGVFFYNGIVWSKYAMFSARLAGNLRLMVFNAMLKLSYEEVEKKANSQWMTRVNSDVRMTFSLLNDALNIPHFVLASVRIVVSGILLAYISKTLFAAMVEGMEIIHLYDAKELMLKRYEESSLQLINVRMKMNGINALAEMVFPILARGGYIMLFFIGCQMIQKGQITFSILVAAFFHISVKAIRLYEKKGIIMPAWVDPDSGYRYYNVNHIHQLNTLIELKSIGFSLNEIKPIMEGKFEGAELTHQLQNKKRDWENLIIMAQSKMEAIEGITKRLMSSKEAEKIQTLTDEERAWLLVKMVCVEDTEVQGTISEAIWL